MQISRQVMRAFLALPFIVAAACFPEGTTDPLANAANMVAQTIPAESSLVGESAAPLPSVLVTNNGGKPVKGAPVTFTITAGNGTVTATSVATDKNGLASTGWTYGSVEGDNILAASLGSIAPVTFKVKTTGGGPAAMVKANDQQSGVVGAALAQPAAVIVTNKGGHPVTGASVQFTAAGGSTLNASGATTLAVPTDANGRAETAWLMGTVPGSYSLTAKVGDLPAETFTATAVAGAPFEIATTGDAQTGTVDLTLPTPLGITVRDQYHNPVSGVAVTWAPQNGGSASPATDLTSATGQSSTQWRLPVTAGAATLNVSAGSLSASFRATATAGAPNQLFKMASSDGQTGDAGQPLAQPISVTVRDAFGNPVPNVGVSFSPASGSADPATASTNADGQANTTWTLGTTSGATTLNAAAVGVAQPVTFTATVRAPEPCGSRGTLVIGTTVAGNLANSLCASPLTRTYADIWTLNLSGSTPVEVTETSDAPNEDSFLMMFRGQYDNSQLVGVNDDIDIDAGIYDSKVRFLGGSGQFLVAASYVTSYVGDHGAGYHLVAKSWSGAVTSCQDVYAVNGTSTNQQLDNDDCPATAARNHADRVWIMLKPGETITVSMNATGFDTKLELENGNGAVVATDDNGGGGTNARLTFTVPAGAPAVDTYGLYATSALANGAGGYSLAVTVSTPPGTSSMMTTSGAGTSSPVGPGVQRLLDARKVKTLR